jgi:hypothetical protein
MTSPPSQTRPAYFSYDGLFIAISAVALLSSGEPMTPSDSMTWQ